MSGHRLLITFLFVFIGTSILAAVMQGGGGIVSTILTEDVAANATVLPVVSTELFNNTDIVRLGNEKILYASKNATAFIVHTRGYEDTTAQAFEAGRRVYSTEAGALNDALGYNMGATIETGGTWGLIMLPINFFTQTVPHLIVLNANLFSTPELMFIAIFWFGAGIALLVILAINIAPIAISIATGIFGLIRR
jgi:hypothetical protein